MTPTQTGKVCRNRGTKDRRSELRARGKNNYATQVSVSEESIIQKPGFMK